MKVVCGAQRGGVHKCVSHGIGGAMCRVRQGKKCVGGGITFISGMGLLYGALLPHMSSQQMLVVGGGGRGGGNGKSGVSGVLGNKDGHQTGGN